MALSISFGIMRMGRGTVVGVSPQVPTPGSDQEIGVPSGTSLPEWSRKEILGC